MVPSASAAFSASRSRSGGRGGGRRARRDRQRLAFVLAEFELEDDSDSSVTEPEPVRDFQEDEGAAAEDGGIESAIRMNKGLKNGVYVYHGILTNKAIGDWFNLPDSDINLIVF